MLKRMAHAAAIVLAIITPLALVAPSAAAQAERIRSFASDIEVRADGSMLVWTTPEFVFFSRLSDEHWMKGKKGRKPAVLQLAVELLLEMDHVQAGRGGGGNVLHPQRVVVELLARRENAVKDVLRLRSAGLPVREGGQRALLRRRRTERGGGRGEET